MPEQKQHDYLKIAKDNLTAPNNITPQQYALRVAAAQAAATIALVEQQKTANLIAASTSGWAWDSVEELDDAQTRIREAVGLPKVKGLRDRIVAELVADFKHVAEAADPVTLEGNIRAIVFSS
jgi:hypothetical protein